MKSVLGGRWQRGRHPAKFSRACGYQTAPGMRSSASAGPWKPSPTTPKYSGTASQNSADSRTDHRQTSR